MDVIVKMDDAHDPGNGHPVYPEDVAGSVRNEPVWGLYEVGTGDDGEWTFTELVDDCTADGAADIASEQYPEARLLG